MPLAENVGGLGVKGHAPRPQVAQLCARHAQGLVQRTDDDLVIRHLSFEKARGV